MSDASESSTDSLCVGCAILLQVLNIEVLEGMVAVVKKLTRISAAEDMKAFLRSSQRPGPDLSAVIFNTSSLAATR